MVDIIFQLLIFFIVANGIMTVEARKKLIDQPADEFARELPSSLSSKPVSLDAHDLLVQVEMDEETGEELYFLVRAGEELKKLRKTNPTGVPLDAILNAVRQLGEDTRYIAVKPSVKIRSDKRTSYGTVMQIMSVCKGAELEPLIEDVTFAVRMRK